MKAKTLIMGILAALCSLFSCNAQTDGFKSVGADDFERIIADTGVVLLDVRTSEEYADGHIAGAKNIDALKDDFEQKACSILPKDSTIALYCRSGRRSKKAASVLSAKGYDVVELNTGYNGWTAAGKKVEK